MKQRILAMALLGAVLLTGCSAGGSSSNSNSSSGGGSAPKASGPKAVTPDTSVDFGNVPVTNDMSQAKTKEFVIRNEGTADLKLSDLQVKLLQGC